MLQMFLAAILVVGLFTGEGLSQQCYSLPNCVTGSEIKSPGDTPKDCCAGTNDGQSYADNSSCVVTRCIVHGFAQAVYEVEEGDRLDTTFELNVKGTTSLPLMLMGTITSEADTARPSDFENLRPIEFEGSTDIRLFTTNDEITLEYNDTIILRFEPSNPAFIPGVEGAGQFIRHTSIVYIIDNDRLEINIEESDYSIQEDAVSNPMIRLQFRRTQSPFTLTITPAKITELNQRFSFNAETFISLPTSEEIEAGAVATPGVNYDFTDDAFTITINSTEDRPPGPISEDIQQDDPVPRFRVIDDDVNEIEQSFALVAVLGDDVPDDFACFQRQVGDTECFNRTGATQIKIVDNDAMIIGFSLRRRIISESDAPLGDFTFSLNVTSLTTSEIEYEVRFRVLQESNATVEAINVQFGNRTDALFGIRDKEEDPIEDSRQLKPNSQELESMLSSTIFNDFIPETTECYDIMILSPDVTDGRIIFTCQADTDVPIKGGFFCVHTICIEDNDKPFEVAYIQTTYTVIESEDYVEVCVNLTEPQVDILDETVRVETFNDENSVHIPADAVLATPDSPDFLGIYPMAEGTDYEEQIRGINRIRDIVINATRRIICYNQHIYDDIRLEVSEYAGLTLAVRDASVLTVVKPMYDQVAIRILDDDDGAVVGLERTFYSVSEGVGAVNVCAIVYSPVVFCPIEFPFNVNLTTSDGSAVFPMDYISVSTILAFDTCDTRQCTAIPIVDDMIVELTESFFVTLERTPGLDSRITLDPVDGEIEITDDDEAVVGLERTSYTVPESVGVVEVCTIVRSPSLPCPIDHPFNVRFSTYDRTAVTPMDYGAVSTILRFAACEKRRCVDVPIINDGDDEPNEMFGITLERTPGMNDRITLDPVDGNITIIDDDEPGEPGILVNDTLTGDPLMTVPIHTDPDVMEGDVITSLCYEVHGEADKFFNLVSDSCVSVNSHYSRALTNPNIDLNIVDAIGVRAVSNNGTCVNIRVGLDCAVTVNDVAIRGRMYRSNGITIRVYPNRVRISVPNCEDTDLVMWVFCTSGRTEDPTNWMYFDFDFIRFVVMRGLNLDEESHGLIGQFWNVPVDVTENTGSFNGAVRNDDYIITVNYPNSPPRSFVGLGYSVTWEFEKRPCLYVGNSQAGPLGETVDPNDSVIEGTYQNYEVKGLFSPDFDFSHFDETQCV